jgi:RimJ/RimL family protein N-acetyltransferase
MGISWRSASLEDADDLFRWRNSYSGRQYSGDSTTISLSHHLEWFHSRLLRVDAEPFYMFMAKEDKVGMCRFDGNFKINKSFEVSVLVNPDFQGSGLGSQILRISCDEIFENYPGIKITARVHLNNLKSIKLFTKIGFVKISVSDTFLILEKY